MDNILQKIIEQYPDEEILKADGLDDAVIGIEPLTMRLIYSITKCIDILQGDQDDRTDVIEFFEYNCMGAYVGEKTPIWCSDEDENE